MDFDANLLLAGDIGGTKTNLLVFALDAGPRAPLAEATLNSGAYPGLDALVGDFLEQAGLGGGRESGHGSREGGYGSSRESGREGGTSNRESSRSGPPDGFLAACFGVAGPVIAGRSKTTNLPWVIDAAELGEALNCPAVTLLNDLEALAHAVPFLGSDDLTVLNQGSGEPQGPLAVIAPGTGLGEAYLTWQSGRYQAHASEGGHADFGPTNDLELALLDYLLARVSHVSYERVCSGRGIPNLYTFLRDTGRAVEPAWLAQALGAAEDPTPVIMNAALGLDGSRTCALCVQTLDLFVDILGAEAGNLALKVVSTGGVYLGGGIPAHIAPALDGARFMAAFQNKGRMNGLLAGMPVHLIHNPKAGLLGAAFFAAQGHTPTPLRAAAVS